jgi:hypothetical protein
MSDLKVPTYEFPSLVGRAFMVQQPSLREANFSRGDGERKMSDPKAPTYKLPSVIANATKNVLTTWLESKRLLGSLLPFDAGQILNSPCG